MLIKDFYTINGRQSQDENAFIYDVTLNPNHIVYKGHFPEKPITPGVCSIQMITELAEHSKAKPLMFGKIDSCRFTSMITPDGTPNLSVLIKISPDYPYSLSATISHNDVTFLTMSGVLIDRV